jgi:putative flavoprotein involved in K+ transport
MLWLDECGLLDMRREEVVRLAGRVPPRGVLGSEHTISLQSLAAKGIVLLGRLVGVADGGWLSFANDVDANIHFANEASDKS